MRTRPLALVAALTCSLSLPAQSEAQTLTVEGDSCPVANTTIPGGGVVQVRVTHNDISCCANFGCIGYDHDDGPEACNVDVRLSTDVESIDVDVSQWQGNVGEIYALDTGASGNVQGQYLDTFCSDNDPIPPWNATIQSETTFAIASPHGQCGVIIDIDSVVNTSSNPVIEFFPADTYTVTPVNDSLFGGFKAWNIDKEEAPSGCVGGICTGFGWLNTYEFSSSELGEIEIGGQIRYETESIAFANASGASFTLTPDDNVSFFTPDDVSFDNLGGISLLIVSDSSGECCNGIDDDADGLTDFPEDPGCFSAANSNESPACNDGLDNETVPDGLIDFGFGPGNDPDCIAFWGVSESPGSSCGLGFELTLLLPLMWLNRRRKRRSPRSARYT